MNNKKEEIEVEEQQTSKARTIQCVSFAEMSRQLAIPIGAVSELVAAGLILILSPVIGEPGDSPSHWFTSVREGA